MTLKTFTFYTIVPLFLLSSCKDTTNAKKVPVQPQKTVVTDTVAEREKVEEEEEKFVLTEENAIEFFFNYNKTLKEDTVKLSTNFGDITIELFDDVPYHKANFIYLTKKGYFKDTFFHRIVKNFIIQGGNADNIETGRKRGQIGRYLLPPDTRKGHKHHRGTVSMPSSEIDNPHMLASPFEFFIVVTKPGSYHLDGDYTPFGKVIEGMDVVDKINSQPVGQGDWPLQNIYILNAEVVK
ncbi:peptidylprolyl isomerase [Sediminicola sp. YIK13]|uniref:peptidylprolyl isomerase n=1 Tax=Sediminicola sp. YIK13 TaxID=1453352 RepID=UPI000721BBB9|nr:peptidylprolyl isomerase [Sediminicola sp. YIK13]ALM06678.1 peptidylprolyl isomerase [Sediminicola sp. YIK13]